MQTLFLVLHLIVSVILIFVVMAQEGKDPGMSCLLYTSPSPRD